jgi:endonuclease-3
MPARRGKGGHLGGYSSQIHMDTPVPSTLPPPGMDKIEKASRIGAALDELYPEPDAPLLHHDPYTLLVAVVLSARNTDKMVNQVTPGLFEVASTPQRMAALEVEQIQHLIRRIGLSHGKARALKGLSEILLQKHGGQVPRTFEELEELPGVGHKTASVVMAQAFGVPAFPVDTHIHRLAARWGLSNGRNVVQTERDLKAVFPERTWNARHVQIILFGREHCPALRHDLASCPICSWAATAESAAQVRPTRRSRARPPP